jgi:hypothetical protein
VGVDGKERTRMWLDRGTSSGTHTVNESLMCVACSHIAATLACCPERLTRRSCGWPRRQRAVRRALRALLTRVWDVELVASNLKHHDLHHHPHLVREHSDSTVQGSASRNDGNGRAHTASARRWKRSLQEERSNAAAQAHRSATTSDGRRATTTLTFHRCSPPRASCPFG